MPTRRVWVALAALALSLALLAWLLGSRRSERVMVLLLPDRAALQEPVTQAWLDAAQEEGLPLVPMTDDEFMRFGGDRAAITGVVLPDSVHKGASELLVSQLHSYVGAGGKLFITFDAGLLDGEQGRYAAAQSRLSRLAGVRYAMYEELRDKSIERGQVFASRQAEARLGIQPGKLDFKNSSLPPLGELTTYGYARLQHNYFRTGAAQGAPALLRSAADDVVVSEHRFGAGAVLFVNLPLGYLKTRTDGYLLHRMLGYFGVDMLRQPRLSPVPNAQGGMVLNLHIDSNSAQAPLLELERAGWFRNGPFSLDVTAGPDAYTVGDRMGLDVDHNPVMQAFLKRQSLAGHEVGNHGGWGHNIFGNGANDSNQAEFEPMLADNNRSISAAIGRPARSYSAPMGKHPAWATRWLSQHGFKAYYFTGDVGLGPTRSYVAGRRAETRLWAFPVANFNRIATFEELGQPAMTLTADDIGRFLDDLAGYVAKRRVARLFYFHPPAAEEYEEALAGLMARANQLAAERRFRWYTMEQLADFLARREQAVWWLAGRVGGGRLLSVSSPVSLRELSWVFAADSVTGLKVVRGDATVRREGKEWIVTAGDGKALEVEWR